jgi:hypothetical protein
VVYLYLDRFRLWSKRVWGGDRALPHSGLAPGE